MNNDKVRETLFHRLDARKYICISDSQDGMGPAIRLSGEERELILKALFSDPWQPISTAPKDGSQILVWFVNSKDKGMFVVTKWDGKVWSVSKNINGALLSFLNINKCTHWQPLPNPPEKK